MKIVINTCFGGFGLSKRALELYAKKIGVPFYVEIGKWGLDTYWIVPPEDRAKELENWHERSLEERREYNETYRKQTLSHDDIERIDPALIEAVEELGVLADGKYAELKVIEIPDGIEYEIEEYDGLETVHEKHRSWS